MVMGIAVLLGPGLSFGQRASFGFIGGTNLTRDFPTSREFYEHPNFPNGLTILESFSDTRSFIAGLAVEVDLAGGLSFEGNALHRNLNWKLRSIFPDGSQRDETSATVSTWEFPLLLKYRIPTPGPVRPFLEAGPSFRTRHNPYPSEPSQIGATFGAGADFRVGRFRVSPTLRYTRWRSDNLPYPRRETRQDQVEFVTGVSYATSLPSWNVGGRKLRLGVIGGAPLTKGLKQFSQPYQRIEEVQGYLGGLAVEIDLSRRFSVEVDGLYRPFQANIISQHTEFGESRFEFAIVTWQIPTLVKYRLQPERKIQPVIEAGPSFRLSGNLNGYNPSRYGMTVGGGAEVYYKALKIGPVLRYTRWAADAGRYQPDSRTVPNQVELLVAFTF